MRVPKHWLAVGAAVSMILLAASCNRPQRYPLPQVPLDTQWSGEGVFKIATPQDGVLRKDWWALFGDPQLNSLEEKAATANPDVQAAAERFTQSRYVITKANAPLLPHLGLVTALSGNKNSELALFRAPNAPIYGNDVTRGAQASWEPDIWSKIRNEKQMDKELAQATSADFALTRLSVQGELAADYMRLRGLDVQDAILRQSIEQFQYALRITELRFNGEIAPRSDVTRAQNQLSSTEARELSIRLDRALLENAIAILTNQSPSSFTIAPEDTFQVHVPEIPIGVPSALLQRRPDIASAERRMTAANTSIGISRAAFYPYITISALSGFSSPGFGLTNLATSLWSYGSSGGIPLFRGGALRAELQRTYAEYRQTSDEYRSVVLNGLREVENSLATLRYLSGEEQKRHEATTAAVQTQDLQMQLYVGDLTSYLDVVFAQITALDARLSEVEVQTSELEGAVGLIRSLGGGWDVGELPAQDTLPPMRANKIE